MARISDWCLWDSPWSYHHYRPKAEPDLYVILKSLCLSCQKGKKRKEGIPCWQRRGWEEALSKVGSGRFGRGWRHWRARERLTLPWWGQPPTALPVCRRGRGEEVRKARLGMAELGSQPRLGRPAGDPYNHVWNGSALHWVESQTRMLLTRTSSQRGNQKKWKSPACPDIWRSIAKLSIFHDQKVDWGIMGIKNQYFGRM